MHKEPNRDVSFETSFFESVLKRDRNYTDVIEILGGLYTKQGRIADGLKMDRRLVRLQPKNSTAHYNLACSLALMKRKAIALRELKLSVELGYNDHAWMAKDPDLIGLREHPEFQKLVILIRAKNCLSEGKASGNL
jgi:tetratricopeptide (TPR) repeat protein